MLALELLPVSRITGPELVLMSSGPLPEEMKVESYEGACLLLAKLIEGDAEFRREIEIGAEGQPRGDAILIAASLYQRAHQAWRREGATPDARAAFGREKGIKICCRCKRPLPLAGFNLDRRASDGRRPVCKECHNSQERKRWAERKEDKIGRVRVLRGRR